MNREFAKKYLAMLAALYLIGGGVLFAILAALRGQPSFAGWSLPALLGLAALFALIPAGNFSGAVWLMRRLVQREKLTKPVIVMLCVLLPVTLLLWTAAGIVLLPVSIGSAVKALIKGENNVC